VKLSEKSDLFCYWITEICKIIPFWFSAFLELSVRVKKQNSSGEFACQAQYIPKNLLSENWFKTAETNFSELPAF